MRTYIYTSRTTPHIISLAMCDQLDVGPPHSITLSRTIEPEVTTSAWEVVMRERTRRHVFTLREEAP